MSGTSAKFCEDCGIKNNIEAKFCKSCGKVFPEIDDPRYQAALRQDSPGEEVQPPQYIVPGINPVPPKNVRESQTIQNPPEDKIPPPQENYPVQDQIPPTQDYDQPHSFQNPPPSSPSPQNYGVRPMLAPTRVWTGTGLVDAIGKLHRDPAKTTPELLEDGNAPSPMILVVIIAFTRALVVYFRETNIVYTTIDVSDDFYDAYATEEGIRDAALTAAGFSLILTFIAWWLLSWIMGLVIKGGLPRNNIVRYETTKSMRRFNAYRYVPLIVYNIIYIILIQFEEKRQGIVSMEETFGIQTPFPVITSDFSSFFITTVLLISILAYLISATVFYRGIKGGLRHEGITPVFIAMIILLTPFYPIGIV